MSFLRTQPQPFYWIIFTVWIKVAVWRSVICNKQSRPNKKAAMLCAAILKVQVTRKPRPSEGCYHPFCSRASPTKHTTKAWLCAFHFQCETIWYNRGILGAYKTRTQECCRIGGKSYVEGEPSHTHTVLF